MIRLQYFARYRELLGSEGEPLPWQPALATLGDLRDHLASRGSAWAEVFSQGNLMCARNQELCSLDEPLADGDEVAFFPPVTGG
ncbi:MoaD/ThiS family protein [Pseudomonas citronellolis]|uniref:Molybdopterin synthase sulfur carrier subunit n=1 Tax=Pseudomonas citronellolis TaxID=53408 RepID=A0AAW6PF38_9PSED|nr:MoaD/ThiS family protein [Pseudomonas citronellolis]MDF3846193.1 MoaD/ThiS family protein [Pseudomonas citronellolis]